jgi:outer membrane protein assembly factor BamB
MYRGSPDHSGAFGSLTLPIAQKWQWSGEAGTKSASSPAVVEGIAYVGIGGQVIALRLEDGGLAWEYPSGQRIPARFRLSPAVGGGKVFCAASDGTLYALDADTGSLAWQFSTHSSVTSPPTYFEPAVFIGTANGKVYALNADTGAPLWQDPCVLRLAVSGPLVVTEDTVIALADDGSVYGIAKATGRPRYRQPLTSVDPDSSLTLAGEFLYVNTAEGLVALTPSNGRARWRTRLGERPTFSPVGDGDRVFTVTESGRVVALDLTGRPVWDEPAQIQYPLITSPALAGDSLVLATRRGEMIMLDAETGAQQWYYVLKPPPGARIRTGDESGTAYYAQAASEPVICGDTLLVLTGFGQLIAFSNKGTVDITAPTVRYMLPEPGETLCGRPPLTFQVGLSDLGSGIVPDSVKLLLDGQPLGSEEDPIVYDRYRDFVFYKTKSTGTVRPLEDGRHTVEIQALDWMGNVLAEKWEITVNNTLSPIARKPREREDQGGFTGYPGGVRGGLGGRGGGLEGGGGRGGGRGGGGR